jgi:hypothetical protein
MATHIHSCQEKVQVTTLCWKIYADSVLGYEWTSSRTLSGERRDSEQCKVEHHAGRETEACSVHSSSWTSVQRHPDLAPSNCHVFGMLKEASQRKRFHSEDKVKEAVIFWLQQQRKTFYLLEYRSLSNDVKSALQRTMST